MYEETVWLTQDAMSKLFDTAPQNITMNDVFRYYEKVIKCMNIQSMQKNLVILKNKIQKRKSK